jgi:hypothetical protein
MAGAIRAELERSGTPIGAYDTLIAGQAVRRGLTQVTANVAEFDRVAGLRWEDRSHAPRMTAITVPGPVAQSYRKAGEATGCQWDLWALRTWASLAGRQYGLSGVP